MNPSLRLAVVRDYRAEGWPSMDLCADQLLAHLPTSVAGNDVAPEFRRVFSRLPIVRGAGFNADRLLNRHVVLAWAVRRAARAADFVHVVDHSYAHVIRDIPPGRAGVYCHDLDAFRSILEPAADPRPWWFRTLARRTLDGLTRAALVFHSTAAIGLQLRDRVGIPADRLVYAPCGVAAEFTPTAPPIALVPTDAPFLLHVGINIPRKRLDVLLDVFAATRARVPGLLLVQVGGPWPAPLGDRLALLGADGAVTQVRGLSRAQLAELYRRAAVVLVPSEAEGFGLPVIEALACGAVVVASDIPTLREAGGAAAIFRPVGDVPAWADAIASVLRDPAAAPARDSRLSHAAQFSWREHARIIAQSYLDLASGGRKPPEVRT